jgi:alkylation response protein AidB-like acyl-CoA dehydrogenase
MTHMDFGLTADQHKRCGDVRDSAGRLHQPPAAAGPHAGRDAWRVAAELGLTGLCLPGDHGGGGLGALDTALCLEAATSAGADTGLLFGIAAHLLACGIPVATSASGDVRAGLLAAMAAEPLIAANAMTEDGAGSDVSRLSTTAQLDGDAYVLNGVKSFVSNGPIADLLVTYAVTDPAAGYLGISAFAVPADLPGITVGPPLAKMGLHGCAAARVEFTGCRVPARYRLGREGQGSAVFQDSMAWERACLPAIYLGVLDGQLHQCARHTRQRRQFGREIAGFQAISHTLATMKQRLESARLLLYRACWLLDDGGDDATVPAALAKVAVSEAAVANGLDAIQIFGALGYLTEHGIERHLRDAVPSTIFSGTTQIQRDMIAREVLA